MAGRQLHPDAPTLALLAGGELPLWHRWNAAWHVRFCSLCQAELRQFRSLRAALPAEALDESAAAETLPGITWSVFEAEMRANIRLGLTAGALAGEAERAPRPTLPTPVSFWRWATVCGALVFVLGAGWWLGNPYHTPTPVVSSVLRLPAEGEDAGAAPPAGFELLIPASDAARTEADFDGATRARLIDGETGRVTLQQVYAQ